MRMVDIFLLIKLKTMTPVTLFCPSNREIWCNFLSVQNPSKCNVTILHAIILERNSDSFPDYRTPM